MPNFCKCQLRLATTLYNRKNISHIKGYIINPKTFSVHISHSHSHLPSRQIHDFLNLACLLLPYLLIMLPLDPSNKPPQTHPTVDDQGRFSGLDELCRVERRKCWRVERRPAREFRRPGLCVWRGTGVCGLVLSSGRRRTGHVRPDFV